MPNSRDITVTIQRPEMRELAREALRQGFRPGGVRKHGVWLLAPNGEDTVSISHTTGDRRALANTLAELKRFGFKDENDVQNGVTRPPTYAPLALKVIEVLVSQDKPMTAQELAPMVGELWSMQFADTVRHLADSGQIERYGKVVVSGHHGMLIKANVYVRKGYVHPAPTPPQPAVAIEEPVPPAPLAAEPEPEPEPEPQPELPPAATVTRPRKMLVGRIIDEMIAVGRPIHMYELAERLGETAVSGIGPALSTLSRLSDPHPYNRLGKIRKRDKVHRPGHSKPIVRYEWVPNPVAEPAPDEPRTEPTPTSPPPEPHPSAVPEEVPVDPDENGPAVIDQVHDYARQSAPVTTLLGKPLYFWEDLLQGLAYGLSKTRERERGAG